MGGTGNFGISQLLTEINPRAAHSLSAVFRGNADDTDII